jgi:outer membrane protein assembly factor BamE (lipoprotein component of BamABCDE complex)
MKGDKMKKLMFVMFLGVFITGCGYMKGIEAASNREKLDKLELGMNQETVREVMGEPYKIEACELYEAWFYITEWQGAARPLYDSYTTNDEMTPLVFENGILKGWGSKFLDEHIKKYEIRIR